MPQDNDADALFNEFQSLAQKAFPQAQEQPAPPPQQTPPQDGTPEITIRPKGAFPNGPASPGDPTGAHDPFGQQLRQRESSGGRFLHNPNSSASGPSQITEGTWKGIMRNNPQLPLTMEAHANPEQFPEQHRLAEQALRAENISALERAGLPADGAAKYAMHFFGQNTGLAFLTSDPATPIDQIADDNALASNPNVLYHKDGSPKTVGELRAEFAEDFGETGTVEPAHVAAKQTGEAVSYADFFREAQRANLDVELEGQYGHLWNLAKGFNTELASTLAETLALPTEVANRALKMVGMNNGVEPGDQTEFLKQALNSLGYGEANANVDSMMFRMGQDTFNAMVMLAGLYAAAPQMAATATRVGPKIVRNATGDLVSGAPRSGMLADAGEVGRAFIRTMGQELQRNPGLAAAAEAGAVFLGRVAEEKGGPAAGTVGAIAGGASAVGAAQTARRLTGAATRMTGLNALGRGIKSIFNPKPMADQYFKNVLGETVAKKIRRAKAGQSADEVLTDEDMRGMRHLFTAEDGSFKSIGAVRNEAEAHVRQTQNTPLLDVNREADDVSRFAQEVMREQEIAINTTLRQVLNDITPRAPRGPGQFPSPVTGPEASAKLFSTLQRAERKGRLLERQAWSRINKDQKVDSKFLKQATKAMRKTFPKTDPEVVPSDIMRSIKKMKKSVKVGDLLALRSRILRHIAAERALAAPAFGKIKNLGTLDELVLDTIYTQANVSTELDIARATSRRFNDVFKRGPIGQALRYRATREPAKLPEEVAEFIAGRVDGTEAMLAVRDNVRAPETVRAFEDALRADFRETAELDPKNASKWMRRMDRTAKPMAELYTDLSNASRSIAKGLRDLDEIGRSAMARIAEDSPQKAISTIYTSRNPVAAARKTRALFSKDPNALAAFQDMMLERFIDMASPSGTALLQRMHKGDTRAILREALGGAKLSRLDRIIREMKRVEDGDMAPLKRLGGETRSLVARVLAARVGRAVGGGDVQTPGIFVRKTQQLMDAVFPEIRPEVLLRKSITDPRFEQALSTRLPATLKEARQVKKQMLQTLSFVEGLRRAATEPKERGTAGPTVP